MPILRNICIAALLFGSCLLFCCKKEPAASNLSLNQQIAGNYSGDAYCYFYMSNNNGPFPTTAQVVAVGPDSLKVETSTACINTIQEFKFDTLFSTGITYSRWKANAPYYELYYYPDFDSILVSTPLYTSYGWQPRDFRGRKN